MGYTNEFDEQIKELRQKGYKVAEIAKTLRKSMSLVNDRLHYLRHNGLLIEPKYKPKPCIRSTLNDDENAIIDNIDKYKMSYRGNKSIIAACPICEKRFLVEVPTEYVYSRHVGMRGYALFCCSYTCFKIADEVYEKSLPKKFQRKKVDMNDYEE